MTVMNSWTAHGGVLKNGAVLYIVIPGAMPEMNVQTQWFGVKAWNMPNSHLNFLPEGEM